MMWNKEKTLKAYEVIDFGNNDPTDGFPAPRILYQTEIESYAMFIRNVLNKNFPNQPFGFKVVETTIDVDFGDMTPEQICSWYKDKFLNKK